MADNEYSASMITVLSLPEIVWKRPAMFFGHARGNPDLIVGVAHVLICDALHPSNGEPVDVVLTIESDRRWTITDNGTGLDEDGLPPKGFAGSLVPLDRWPLAAVAAISTWTRIEVWEGGRTWYQELRGMHPVAEPRPGEPRAGRGTRATTDLDPGFFLTDSPLPRDTSVLPHDPSVLPADASVAPAPGSTLRIVDLRAEQVLREGAAVVLEGLDVDPDLGDHARG